jgi:hypothetical protein
LRWAASRAAEFPRCAKELPMRLSVSKRVSAFALVSLSMSGVAHAETDPRDYHAIGFLPDRTMVFTSYLRSYAAGRFEKDGHRAFDVGSLTQSLMFLRLSYLVDLGGGFSLIPDLLVPAGSVTLAGAPLAEAGSPVQTITAAGVGDPLPFVTVGYTIKEAHELQTVIAVTPSYVSIPVGQYDAKRPVNLGMNRWGFKPQLAISQQLPGYLVAEVVASVQLYTKNDDIDGKGTDATYDPTLGLEAHLSGNLNESIIIGVSNYYSVGGREHVMGTALAGTKVSTDTVRVTFGAFVSKHDLLYVQYSEDVSVNDGFVNNLLGLRYTHLWGM